MKIDPLKQYAKLRQALLAEKSQLESRLHEINQVLGSESVPAQPSSQSSTETSTPRPVTRRGRKRSADNAMSMREAVLKALSNGPLARKELVPAVEALGYKFTTRNPLNSIGSILYAKNTPVKSKRGKFYLPGNASIATNGSSANSPAPAKRKKGKRSAAARANMAAAQKARWARIKAGK